MANNLFTGPNAAVAKTDISFVSAGFTTSNCTIIYEVGSPNKSWKPDRGINPISAFTTAKGYYIVMKQAFDAEAILIPPIPEGGGGTTPTPAFYNIDSAANFISLANPTAFQFGLTTPFVVGFWYRQPTEAGVLRLGLSTASKRVWDVNMGFSGGNVVGSLAFLDDNQSAFKTNNTALDDTNPINEWHYYTFRQDSAGLIHCYIDGVKVSAGTNTVSGTVATLATGTVFKIGQIGTLVDSTGADLDTLTIANADLSDANVAALFTANGIPTAQSWWAGASAKAYLTFDHDLTDATGAHNGTATTPSYTDN